MGGNLEEEEDKGGGWGFMELPPPHSVQLQWRSNSSSVAGIGGGQEQNHHLIRSPTGQQEKS